MKIRKIRNALGGFMLTIIVMPLIIILTPFAVAHFMWKETANEI
jgi:ABC-type uncharacterized transport system involved in gliding motility auxiliary subunit